jgi:uncharacterized membrane protein
LEGVHLVPKKILVAGESWITHSVHIKGFDSFTTDSYEEGVHWLRQAFERADYVVDFMPNHLVPSRFPVKLDDLRQYAAVFFSDVGSNSLLLNPLSFVHAHTTANRLDLLAEYVAEGGAFAMIGGYMSFSGIEGKARYAGTAVERILPVHISATDDRVELPQGFRPEVTQSGHPILAGLSSPWPTFLGYNRVTAKPESAVLLQSGDDPFLVVGTWGRGKTMAFASDCGPHWAPPPFLDWQYHDRFWGQALDWLTSEPRNVAD